MSNTNISHKRARPLKIADNVYEWLMDLLLSGEMKPGQRLRETDLAKQFEVSPTPVREALARLERDGLVKIEAHRGAIVTIYTEEDILELQDIRELLEVQSLEKAFGLGRITNYPELITRMQEIVKEGKHLVELGKRKQYNKLDVEFHDIIVQLSGSKRLVSVYRTLVNQIQMIRFQTIHLPGRPDKSQLEHGNLVDAILSMNVKLAIDLLREHLQSTTHDLLESFTAKQQAKEGVHHESVK